MRIGTALTVAGLALTGRYVAAATIAAAWLCSRPLTHAAAAPITAVGAVDARLHRAVTKVRFDCKAGQYPNAAADVAPSAR